MSIVRSSYTHMLAIILYIQYSIVYTPVQSVFAIHLSKYIYIYMHEFLVTAPRRNVKYYIVCHICREKRGRAATKTQVKGKQKNFV